MTKQKQKLIAIICIVCAVLIVIGAVLGVIYYLNNRITFTISDTLADGQGKKARVILLGGQSNASGCSRDDCLQENVSEEKYAEYRDGYDNVYINYFASGNNQSQEFVKCSVMQGEAGGYFGPELGIAEELNEMYPDETFFIIKYAWGGTDLYNKWLSPSSDGKTGDLYKAFTAFVETSMKYLISKNYDVEIEAMCWMQGESDSFMVETATNYGEHLSNFIKDMRKKFSRYAADDGIAFIDAYIADNPMYWVYCEIINAKKDEVAALSEMNVLIDTISQGLTCSEEPSDAPDLAHYDSMSEIKLGNLFAEEAARFFN